MLKEIIPSEFGSIRKPNARKRASLSLGAPEIKIHDFLKRMPNETHQSEPGSSTRPNAGKRTNLSLGAPEVKLHHLLIQMLKETDQSEPGSSLKEMYGSEQLDAFKTIAYKQLVDFLRVAYFAQPNELI